MVSAPPNPTELEALQRQIADLQAKLAAAQQVNVAGSGAVEQGGGDALGERSTKLRDDFGTVNTGTTIATQGGAVVHGSVNAGGHFIGRDFVQYIQGGEDPEQAKSVIALYLHALTRDLAGLKLSEIDSSVDQAKHGPLQVADVYVPLDTTLRIPHDAMLATWLSRNSNRKSDDAREQHETRSVSALEALAAHRELTLLGKPGSGKSTFGATVLLALAQAWQGHKDQLAKLGETWRHGPLLPIRVVLRRFAQQLPPGDEPARAGDLWDFVARDLHASSYGLSAHAMKYVQRIVRSPGALVLFDGLDECGDTARRRRVLAAVEEVMRSAGESCRFLLTARPYAWPGGADPDRGVYMLADFDEDQIEQFIQAWYDALVKHGWLNPGEATRKRDELLWARHRPDLLDLCQIPLLLTLIATLHTNRSRLPDDRADLYNESVDMLMLRWNRQIGADKALLDELAIPSLKLSDLREVLEEVAFTVHEQNACEEGAADIGEERLLRAFKPLLNDSWDKAASVLDYIEKRAGLLVGQGEKDGKRQFAFPHRTFQEFLAACHLAARGDFPAECVRLARATPAHWQLVLPLAARVAKAERGASAADELIGGTSIAEFCTRQQPNADDWTCALLAGMQLQEVGLGAINRSARTRAIAMRVVAWLAASLPLHPDEGGLPARQRASAGNVLAALGDPRFDRDRFFLPADDLLGFARIPADPNFTIGTRKTDVPRVTKIFARRVVSDNEINDDLSPTPEFFIARYPVTVGQFKAFVNATRVSLGIDKALRDPDSRPLRFVSWHDALAYCEWLNHMFATSSVLEGSPIASLVRDSGWRVSLPSELEWEKAARGGLRDAVFPWGDAPDPNRANYNESGIGDTSAVGCFPSNGFGLSDMAGNVFEWTRSLWGSNWDVPDFKYPYRYNDEIREDLRAREASRVGRGGTFELDRDIVRCSCRFIFLPDLRINICGFRVVLRSTPVS